MALEIQVTAKGLMPKPLTEAELCPRGLQCGHWNHAGVLDEGPDPDGRVLCDPARLGRGLYLQAAPGEKRQVRLRQTLPCTPDDIGLLCRMVKLLCERWKTDRFTADGETVRLSELDGWREKWCREGLNLLHDAAGHWEGEDLRMLTAARFPIYLEPDAVAKLREAKDLDFFTKYLQQKQARDVYYAKPSFYQRADGAALGIYTLTERTDAIFPLAPFVPPLYSLTLENFRLRDEQVNEWQVSLVRVWEENGQMQGRALGTVPFDVFARRASLEARPRFDQRHVLLRVDDLDALLRDGADGPF